MLIDVDFSPPLVIGNTMVSFKGSVSPGPQNQLGYGRGAQPLPVIIAGAGPSGLIAALTLQKYGVPFIIYEQTASSKLCSNAGRGIDMSPSVIHILEKEVGLSHKLDAAMKSYEYMNISDMSGKHINTLCFKDMGERKRHVTGTRNFGFVSRSKLQHVLLEALDLVDRHGRVRDSPNGILRCGIAVTGYKKMIGSNYVQVQLDNSMKVKASALLACDGVHSYIRRCMHDGSKGAFEDVLDSTNQEAWWGTTNVRPGSALEQELLHIAASRNMQGYNVGLVVLGTSQNPGTFLANEVSRNVYSWSYFVENETSHTNADADLMRRGGKVVGEAEKQELVDKIPSTCKILKLFSQFTPAKNINRSAVFHRSSNLPSVDGRVVLLGDAAQYHHPLRGEGSNKAIVDAFVAAMRLATAIMGKSNDKKSKKRKMSPSVERVLLNFDSSRRCKENNSQVKKSYKFGQSATSNSSYTCWARTTYFKFMSPKKMIRELCKGDKANSRFISDMKKELKPYPQPAKNVARPVNPASRAYDNIEMDLTTTTSFKEEDVSCLCIGF